MEHLVSLCKSMTAILGAVILPWKKVSATILQRPKTHIFGHHASIAPQKHIFWAPWSHMGHMTWAGARAGFGTQNVGGYVTSRLINIKLGLARKVSALILRYGRFIQAQAAASVWWGRVSSWHHCSLPRWGQGGVAVRLELQGCTGGANTLFLWLSLYPTPVR